MIYNLKENIKKLIKLFKIKDTTRIFFRRRIKYIRFKLKWLFIRFNFLNIKVWDRRNAWYYYNQSIILLEKAIVRLDSVTNIEEKAKITMEAIDEWYVLMDKLLLSVRWELNENDNKKYWFDRFQIVANICFSLMCKFEKEISDYEKDYKSFDKGIPPKILYIDLIREDFRLNYPEIMTVFFEMIDYKKILDEISQDSLIKNHFSFILNKNDWKVFLISKKLHEKAFNDISKMEEKEFFINYYLSLFNSTMPVIQKYFINSLGTGRDAIAIIKISVLGNSIEGSKLYPLFEFKTFLNALNIKNLTKNQTYASFKKALDSNLVKYNENYKINDYFSFGNFVICVQIGGPGFPNPMLDKK